MRLITCCLKFLSKPFVQFKSELSFDTGSEYYLISFNLLVGICYKLVETFFLNKSKVFFGGTPRGCQYVKIEHVVQPHQSIKFSQLPMQKRIHLSNFILLCYSEIGIHDWYTEPCAMLVVILVRSVILWLYTYCMYANSVGRWLESNCKF